MEIPNNFYTLSRTFCTLLEETKKFKKEDYKNLSAILLQLCMEALNLPEVNAKSDIEVDIERISVSFDCKDDYREIWNPLEDEEPVCGCLADDFGDIYRDLKEGQLIYEKNCLNDAIWNWKWSFENHWSYHAFDALRVLNWLSVNK